MTVESARIGILGGGAWGTALAIHLSGRGVPVGLWIHEDDLVERMRQRRDNPIYLPGHEVPALVVPTGRVDEAVSGVALAVLAVPSPFAREVYRRLAPSLGSGVPVVVATKGIEEETLLLPTQVAAACLPAGTPVAALSGPSFAEEVARGVPTAVVAAAADPAVAATVQSLLSGETLRLYTTGDVVGVQVAAALKNVVAIAAGIVDGLGLGHNTAAALITRGLAEMRRLGVAMGASGETFAGLSALGDLVLTCTGSLSRNRQVGRALGRGERLRDVTARMRHVAEGVGTTRSAWHLARRHDVTMPIVDEVHRILYEEGDPAAAVRRLMTRPLGAEEPAGLREQP
ncbi:MAG TPA: NAD(P)H-dependent glycerol-3-phosphate dehydrogenase [Candidatus Polarisedimenticolaceae bacterium]|nr:NAD(P)H-dependent glycerol-3-phosphate dehydrogenase [Candidatus Polarisedimenticolaceae bacterium]